MECAAACFFKFGGLPLGIELIRRSKAGRFTVRPATIQPAGRMLAGVGFYNLDICAACWYGRW